MRQKNKLFSLMGLAIITSPVFAETTSPIDFSGSYRMRYESLNNAVRAGASGGDQVLASRLLASIKLHQDNLFGELELEDSRTWLDDKGTPLGTDDVNTLEPLQAYLGWRQHTADYSYSVKAGRFTMDVGSRRFVARNRFRNTLNAFTGIDASLDRNDWHWRAFYTLPVQRLPSDYAHLDNNDTHIDETHIGSQFWGLHLTKNHTGIGNVEGYYFGLNEQDQHDFNTRNRHLSTLGFRVNQKTKQCPWLYEVEAAYQFGETHATASANDNTVLDVSAYFIHGKLGYQLHDRLSSTLEVLADYASGDHNPNDKHYNRFDTLYGARRFDFGPTGIYGAFARSNIWSPGVRWQFKPAGNMSAYIGYRMFWLADSNDALTATGVKDTSGDSGDFVGRQLQARLQWHLTKQLMSEFGAVYLQKGTFLEKAPNAADTGDTSYVYTQVSYQF